MISKYIFIYKSDQFSKWSSQIVNGVAYYKFNMLKYWCLNSCLKKVLNNQSIFTSDL